jgi:hypothetical protein
MVPVSYYMPMIFGIDFCWDGYSLEFQSRIMLASAKLALRSLAKGGLGLAKYVPWPTRVGFLLAELGPFFAKATQGRPAGRLV